MKSIFKNLQVIFAFTIIWIILNENIRPLTIGIGILISILTLRLTNGLLKLDYAKTFSVSPLSFIVYIVWIIFEVYYSGYDMFKRILKGDIQPTFLEYESKFKDQLSLVLLSNTITLPPGSVTVDRQDQRLTIIVADSDQEKFRKEIERIETNLERIGRRR